MILAGEKRRYKCEEKIECYLVGVGNLDCWLLFTGLVSICEERNSERRYGACLLVKVCQVEGDINLSLLS